MPCGKLIGMFLIHSKKWALVNNQKECAWEDVVQMIRVKSRAAFPPCNLVASCIPPEETTSGNLRWIYCAKRLVPFTHLIARVQFPTSDHLNTTISFFITPFLALCTRVLQKFAMAHTMSNVAPLGRYWKCNVMLATVKSIC